MLIKTSAFFALIFTFTPGGSFMHQTSPDIIAFLKVIKVLVANTFLRLLIFLWFQYPCSNFTLTLLRSAMHQIVPSKHHHLFFFEYHHGSFIVLWQLSLIITFFHISYRNVSLILQNWWRWKYLSRYKYSLNIICAVKYNVHIICVVTYIVYI